MEHNPTPPTSAEPLYTYTLYALLAILALVLLYYLYKAVDARTKKLKELEAKHQKLLRRISIALFAATWIAIAIRIAAYLLTKRSP